MDYFQAKEFKIYHHNSPQKVTTDSIILGSWTNPISSPKTILDIGSGNGILALMMSQKFSTAKIDAVEINNLASKDAQKNFSLSPWSNRITLFNENITKFTPTTSYDLIIANPPYFENSLHSNNERRKHARHQTELTYNQLLSFSSQHLSLLGTLSIIIPYIEHENIISIAKQHNLFHSNQLVIKTKTNTTPKLICLSFNKKKSSSDFKQLIIHDKQNSYSKEYIALTEKFYSHKLL